MIIFLHVHYLGISTSNIWIYAVLMYLIYTFTILIVSSDAYICANCFDELNNKYLEMATFVSAKLF